MQRILSIILVLVLIFSLAACSTQSDAGTTDNGNSSSEPTKITFYTYNMMSTQAAGVEKLLGDFHAANKDVEVEVVYAQSTDLNTKIQADIASGITPDIIQLTFDALDFGVNNFGVQNLNDIAEKDELAAHLEGFEPAALEVAKLDGKLVGLPYTFSTPVLFYNATLFEQAGLDPDSPPITWKEVEQYALQIKEVTGIDGFVFGGTTANDWLVQGLLKSNGGSVMSSDRKTIQFGEKEAVDAISMLQKMRQNSAHSEMSDYQAWEAFPAGNLGMMLTTSAMQANMIQGANAAGWELRTAKMPSFGSTQAVPVNSGSGLFICSEDPDKQQAAWKFLKYVTSEEGYTTITTLMGYPPLRPAIVEDEKYLKQWAEENTLVGPNLEQLAVVSQWKSYPGSNWQQIELLLMDAFNRCLFTDADVAQTMKDAQTQAQSLMP